MVECVFCKIIEGQIPSSVVFSDEHIMAFLDINPANKGHTLIMPKRHYNTFNDIPVKELSHLFEVVQRVSKAVEKGLAAEGYNILINNKKAAGQLVEHVHIHVIPRHKGDDMAVRLGWSYKKYEGNEIKEVADKIRKNL
ncbi:MAG: HIT family protein [Candidatus Micrarchaeia archaeon]